MRRGLLLGSAVGAVNGGLGLLLAWWFGRRSGDFGWYSYSPMPRRYADYWPAATTPGWEIALVVLASFLIVNTAAAAAIVYWRRRAAAGTG